MPRARVRVSVGIEEENDEFLAALREIVRAVGRMHMSRPDAQIARTTKEADIELSIDLDGTGATDIDTMASAFSTTCSPPSGAMDCSTCRCARRAILKSTVITRWKMSASSQARPSHARLVTSAASDASVRSSCPWTEASSWRRSISQAAASSSWKPMSRRSWWAPSTRRSQRSSSSPSPQTPA